MTEVPYGKHSPAGPFVTEWVARLLEGGGITPEVKEVLFDMAELFLKHPEWTIEDLAGALRIERRMHDVN